MKTGTSGVRRWIGLLSGVLVTTTWLQAEEAAGDATAGAARVNAFGRAFVARTEATGNRIASPYSLYAALTLTFPGARGATATQMAGVLQSRAGDAALWPDLAAAAAPLREAPQASVEFVTAQRVWMQVGFEFLPDFVATLKRTTGDTPGHVDFAADPEAARQGIDRWAAQATKQKIPALLGPGALPAETRLVLVSAVYFKGAWAQPFDPARTRREAFHGLVREGLAPLMHQQGLFAYAERDGVQVLELLYEGAGVAMDVLLPPAGGLAAAEAKAAAKPLEYWLEGLDSRQVDLTFPRFRIASGGDVSARLAALGMPDAFSRAKADFSGMSGRDDLYLAAVFHRACVEVTEKGTEAAAGSGAVVVEKGATSPAKPPVVFRADRPFLFYLRDTNSGLVYFAGCVAEM